MRIRTIESTPRFEIAYLNSGRRPNDFFLDRLPVFKGIVDDLPGELDAIVVTADLQGREPFPEQACGMPIRLIGEVLPRLLSPVLDHMNVNSSQRVGAILAGDFYTYPDLRGRGGTGDVTAVWQAFADEYKWVVGVAGNHDTFDGMSKPRASNQPHVHFLDETRVEVDELSFAGLSGIIGNPRKNFRRNHEDFLESLELILGEPTDLLVMHDGPAGYGQKLRGIEEARDIVEHARPSMVIRGHKHWPIPLADLANGVQVLNVEATVVVLVRS